MPRPRTAFALLITCLLVPELAYAQWPSDDTTNVMTVNSYGCAVASLKAVPDGLGGAIGAIAPSLCSNGRPGWEAGRVSAAGIVLWPDETFLMPAYSTTQWDGNAAIVPDGAGGVTTWWTLRNGEVRARFTDPDGATGWGGTDGQLVASPIATPPGDAASDGAGGSISAWTVYGSSAYEIRAQRLDVSGAPQWTNGGVTVSGNAIADWLQVVPDEAHGAWVLWRTYGGTSLADLHANRIASDGSLPWGVLGVQPAAAANSPVHGPGHLGATGSTIPLAPDAAPDGAGGVIVAWSDATSDPAGDLYAMRIDPDGVAPWGPTALAVGPGAVTWLRCAPDSGGGAIVVWSDGTTVVAQRIDQLGQKRWSSVGVAMSTAAGTQTEPDVTGDTEGGAYVVWSDTRDGAADIYAQHLDGAGQKQWSANGDAVCAAVGTQSLPRVVDGRPDHAIALWVDQRIPGLYGDAWDYYDVFSQRIPLSASVAVAPAPTPKRVELAGFSPNPAVGIPQVRFALPQAGEVRFELLDPAGRRIAERSLFESAGRHVIALPEAAGLRPGLYWMRLRALGEVVQARGTLLR